MKVVDYLAIEIKCEAPVAEILVAELSYLGYDSMMEIEGGIEAYIKPDIFNKSDLEALKIKYKLAGYTISEVIEKNWNEEWEKNYDPISVEDKVRVRADFHAPDSSYKYEIIINPRMSFGTGHHATTYLMLKNQLEVDHKDKRVLDAGCGTAILAIMAEKLGAKSILAYDNNSWSTENAPDNTRLNNCKHVEVQEGTIETINIKHPFDIILANINKNVLLDEMPSYVKNLAEGGKILFSGFYEYDAEDIKIKADECGLTFNSQNSYKDWACVIFDKK